MTTRTITVSSFVEGWLPLGATKLSELRRLASEERDRLRSLYPHADEHRAGFRFACTEEQRAAMSALPGFTPGGPHREDFGHCEVFHFLWRPYS